MIIDIERRGVGSGHEYLSSRIDYFVSDQSNKFSIQEKLGQGGNAVVYECFRADAADAGESLAVKFIFNNNGKTKKRFKREMTLLKAVSHPHIIKYFDSGTVKLKSATTNKQYAIDFIVMERADKTLQDYLDEQWNGDGKKDIDYAVYFPQFIGMSAALGELHKQAIHRDIKPDNILICGETWKISDFGLCSFIVKNQSNITNENEKVGPALWLSPEAVNGKLLGNSKNKINPSSDVFQLAEVLWFVVNKRHPQGIVTATDWMGPKILFDVVYNALLNNSKKRIINGEALYNRLNEIIGVTA